MLILSIWHGFAVQINDDISKSTGILLLCDLKIEIRLHYQLFLADFFFLYLNKSNVFVQKDNTAELHVGKISFQIEKINQKRETVKFWCFWFRSSRTLGVTPRPPYRETSVCTPCINSPYHWTGSVCTMCRPPRPPVRTRRWHDNAQFYKYV